MSDLILAFVLLVLAGLGAEGVRAFVRRQLRPGPVVSADSAVAVEPAGA